MDVRKEFPKRDSGRKSRVKMAAWKAKEYKVSRSAEDWRKTLGTKKWRRAARHRSDWKKKMG